MVALRKLEHVPLEHEGSNGDEEMHDSLTFVTFVLLVFKLGAVAAEFIEHTARRMSYSPRPLRTRR